MKESRVPDTRKYSALVFIYRNPTKRKTNDFSLSRYSAYSFSAAEHGGTHLDSPFHFNPAGWTVDKIPASSLIDVPAFLIDVSKAVNELATPSDFRLEVSHIIQHEIESNRIIPFGGVLLIHTGWSKFWPNKEKYLGWNNATNPEGDLSFPG